MAGSEPRPPGPAFQLVSPTPNPARDQAWLRFAIPSAARVQLAIYRVDGRLVKTLIDGLEPAGWHRVLWDRRDSRGMRSAAGVYLAKLEATSRVTSHKLVLLP